MPQWHPDPEVNTLIERHFELSEDEHMSYMAHDGEMSEITREREQVEREIEKAKYEYEKTRKAQIANTGGTDSGQRSGTSGAPDSCST